MANLNTTVWDHGGWVEGSWGGGVIGFSHQICTDLKNGPVELQKA